MNLPTASLVLLPVLAGCHLFSSGTIGTTCEDVGAGCTDTGQEDTAPFVPPNPYTTRFVVGVNREVAITVRVVDAAEGVVLEASTDASHDPGPVAFDDAGSRLFYYDNATRFLHVLANGTDSPVMGYAPDIGVTSIVAVDLEAMDGQLYLLAPDALYRLDTANSSFVTVAYPGSFLDARSVFPTPDGQANVLDRGEMGGYPDLWRVDLSSGGTTYAFTNFDDGQGRASHGFLGPDDAPWVCSVLGATYAVADLNGGAREPAVLPDAADVEILVGSPLLDDVSDCEWDEAAARFVMASPSAGILGIDAWNSVDPIVPPQAGETPFAAAFVPAPAAR
jgi:hypothetical protein